MEELGVRGRVDAGLRHTRTSLLNCLELKEAVMVVVENKEEEEEKGGMGVIAYACNSRSCPRHFGHSVEP